jgi:hypothetical protein
MKELSLHILDIAQNSIRAGANLVELTIDEDLKADRLSITIGDDGCGIPEDKLPDITNPFVTSRKTRRVGLGLSLFKDAAEACDGSFSVESQVGVGTTVQAVFRYNHIDRAPLGDMSDTVITMIMSFGTAELLYTHRYNGKEFVLDTREIKAILEEDSLMNDPEVLNWIRGYVADGLSEIMEE